MEGKHAVKAWFGVCLVTFLTACSQGGGFADLDKFMADTRAKPRGHVEPLPEFKAYEAFSYSAADRRAPFEPPIDVQLTMVDNEPVSDVEPNLDRPREVLENFDLKSLNMVGTLQRVEGGLFALIKDSTGGIHRVRAGNYMGQNYGRIVGISETRIELIEIVPNGRGGWVERPRSLTLDEEAG
ncbi:MAG: pilus assembly protein PilP [Gammaproteobacteria bacterium]|uniref:Type IV pilus biogenesis protein PilP n=1 Tax=Marinobacter nitratireducens TaxID=1137280 RepID=A0A072MWV5_9GAMM|nr:pilus assembly protein PilP [Marinobacter nitratireducens]KEF29741.1 Type IV pilus biogenesis protein PilP [Marinobacter nitratireducens]TNE70850.1 MAG: pilus assembly protein PilP [Gammaproteobacteria bacterium]TNE97610.1 MAG: pilus assembly protein PilP [Gammaproteobacteria bacterium]